MAPCTASMTWRMPVMGGMARSTRPSNSEKWHAASSKLNTVGNCPSAPISPTARGRSSAGAAGDRVAQRGNNSSGQTPDEILVRQPQPGGRDDAEYPSPLHPQPTIGFELGTNDSGDISLVSGDRVNSVLRLSVTDVVE